MPFAGFTYDGYASAKTKTFTDAYESNLRILYGFFCNSVNKINVTLQSWEDYFIGSPWDYTFYFILGQYGSERVRYAGSISYSALTDAYTISSYLNPYQCSRLEKIELWMKDLSGNSFFISRSTIQYVGTVYCCIDYSSSSESSESIGNISTSSSSLSRSESSTSSSSRSTLSTSASTSSSESTASTSLSSSSTSSESIVNISSSSSSISSGGIGTVYCVDDPTFIDTTANYIFNNTYYNEYPVYLDDIYYSEYMFNLRFNGEYGRYGDYWVHNSSVGMANDLWAIKDAHSQTPDGVWTSYAGSPYPQQPFNVELGYCNVSTSSSSSSESILSSNSSSFSSGGYGKLAFGMASGIRPETTATGQAHIDAGVAGAYPTGQMVIINPD